VKRLNFGLAYGMGPGKLSGMIKVSFREAEKLIDDYFRVFPRIGALLGWLGKQGVENGVTMTLAPFYRRRWFPDWRYHTQSIRFHLEGQYSPALGKIEREAKNMPIQGSGGDMCKVAVVLMYNKIHANNYPVKLRMQVHDQIDTSSRKDFTERWRVEMDEIMREAANLIIPNGLLKSETTVTPVWSK